MSKRRSRLEIVLTVLSAVAEGVDKPTRIMYATNTSWTSNQNMLSELVELGLLEVEYNQDKGRSNRRYTITEKGANLLNYFDKAKELQLLEGFYTGD